MAKYRFIYKNGGWWLKISTIEELAEYTKSTRNPLAEGFASALNSREFGRSVPGEPLRPHVNNAGYAIGFRAEKERISLFESACSLAAQMDDLEVEQLKKGYNLYFNRNGGWHYGKNDYQQWYDSNKLIFPDFKKNQIKVERFPMGTHYYAYVDNMQVRDGDTLKWNTYEEAYNKALQYVTA